MLNKRHVLAAFALGAAIAMGAALSPGTVAQATEKPFDPSAFAAAQAAEKPILIEVTAPWCTTCKAQAPILARLKNELRFKELVAFNVDFDSQKDLLRKFRVQSQSTLIVFKGTRETGRSTGDTKPASIEALLAKAI